MKMLKCAVVALLAGWMSVSAEVPEFDGLNFSRQGRVAIVEKAIDEKICYEGEDGFLVLRAPKGSLADVLVEVENKDRVRQFSLIAKSSNSSLEEVGRKFALKNGYDPLDGSEVTLRLHGSNTIGASLVPALVKEFLVGSGYASDVRVRRNGIETRLYYQPKAGGENLSVVEVVAHGSSTAFGETEENRGVGLAGKYCDIGMASRPIKDSEAEELAKKGLNDLRENSSVFPIAVDGVAVIVHPSNPVEDLTVLQIARLFSGEVKNWKELGGSDLPVTVLSRDAQSGTFDTFKSKVLKPTGKSLSSDLGGRFEQNSDIVKRVGSEKGSVGFIGLSSMNERVKALSVRATEETRSFYPSRLTLKSLDYPLSRLLYLYAPTSRSSMANELLSFVMSDQGQSVVDKEGLIGQGLATSFDREQAAELKKSLVSDVSIPEPYREAIERADREDSGFNVRFSSGKTNPDANSANNLKRLVSLLAESSMDEVGVVLIGFADSRGDSALNLRLSKKRSEEVAEYLRRQGVKSIKTLGLGEIMPVGDNSTDSGRAANRRVEVWLKRPEPSR